MINKSIIALDNMSYEETKHFLSNSQELKIVKIGMEMFYRLGKDFIFEVHNDFNKEIFLDLKLHDIPNTVSKAISSLKGLPIKFLTIHVTGGSEMIKAAMESKVVNIPETQILGVSYLTSLSESAFKEIYNINESEISSAFERIFSMGIKNKIDGFILSGKELDIINKIEKEYEPLKICPGIRFQDEIDSGNTQDQSRVSTPENTFDSGADYLVIGRSITKAKNLSQRIKQLQAIEEKYFKN